MACCTILVPLPAHQIEAFKQAGKIALGPRRSEYEESRRRLGIRSEQTWIVYLPQAVLGIVYVDAREPAALLAQMETSELAFDRWYLGQVWDVSGAERVADAGRPPVESVLDWRAETPESASLGRSAQIG